MSISQSMLIQIWYKLWLNYQKWLSFNLKGWDGQRYRKLFRWWVSNYSATCRNSTRANTGLLEPS